MDPTLPAIISTILGSQVLIRILDQWMASRTSSSLNSTSRLVALESKVELERTKSEEVQGKLFDLAVKHEGLLVRFELLQVELRACKETLNGTNQAVPHKA